MSEYREWVVLRDADDMFVGDFDNEEDARRHADALSYRYNDDFRVWRNTE